MNITWVPVMRLGGQLVEVPAPFQTVIVMLLAALIWRWVAKW